MSTTTLMITKKDGSIKPFDIEKIRHAVVAADVTNIITAELMDTFIQQLTNTIPPMSTTLTVDDIHDLVLHVMTTVPQFTPVAIRYRSYRTFRQTQIEDLTQSIDQLRMSHIHNTFVSDAERTAKELTMTQTIETKRQHITKHVKQPLNPKLMDYMMVQYLKHDELYDVLEYYLRTS